MRSPWFSISDGEKYSGDEPAFFNPEEFDWAKRISEHTAEIKTELEYFLSRSDLITYFNSTMTGRQHSWKTISMKWWGLEVYRHQGYFRRTTELVNSIPGVVSASFNMLDADSVIKPHNGDTNGIYRCHLGLTIPAGLPSCGFRVENEKKGWKEGEWIIFVDALEHEAWNHSPARRYILVVDVIRPEFEKYTTKICSTVLTSLFLQKLAERFRILYRVPVKTRKRIAMLLRPFSIPAMWSRNFASRIGLVD